MVWPFTLSQHQKNVAFKRQQREERISALKEFQKPLTSEEKALLSENIEPVVKKIQAGELNSVRLLKAYGKAALISQEKTNCCTEIMISDAEEWAKDANLSGPLAGFPVSLKDTIYVKGYDATGGYSALANSPVKEDGALVRLLRDAGAVPYVKTNVPFTLMSADGQNDLFGRGVNPWNPKYGPGGSSQGEGALIGSGGSRVGIGSDIGGSVRVPAAWSGIYALRFSSNRFPIDGDIFNDDGFEGIQSVASPMAATLKDLKYFTNAVMGMEPWKYDYTVVNQRWRPDVKLPQKPKVGVLRMPDFVPLTPAIERALSTTVDALKKQGYEVVDFDLPEHASVYHWAAMKIYQADGFTGVSKLKLPGENNDPNVQACCNYAWWPKPLRRIFEFFLSLFGYKEKAELLRSITALSADEYFGAVSERQSLRRGVYDKWNAEKIDFLITAAHPSPAFPNGEPNSLYTVLFTVLWNLLDYPAGVIPVGRVDKNKDALPSNFNPKKLNYGSQITFSNYNAEDMHGLPLAIQVVAQRYHDEEALAAMELVEKALHEAGVKYE